MNTHLPLPRLFVEGPDDVGVVNALLYRHGLDTERGHAHLQIIPQHNVEKLLVNMPEAIRAATDMPVGFVVDIDVGVASRWGAVRGRLTQVGVSAPEICPPEGYVSRIPEYRREFGVWLMPDCETDNFKLEHLCETLISDGDPLWSYAKHCVGEAAKIVDEANQSIAEEQKKWKRYRDVDRIKSEIHTWLSWKDRPGEPLGAAINAHILAHDSPQALAFLRWLKRLYGFEQLRIGE